MQKNSIFCFGPTLETDSESVEKTHASDLWQSRPALGHVRNFAASNLAAGKNKCVALIMDAVAGTMQTLPAAALNQVLINAGYTLMILLHNNEKMAMENCISKLEQRICDAAVMIPPPESILDQHLIDRIAGLPIPLCFIDRWLENLDAAVATTHVEKTISLLLENVLSENLDGAFILPPQDNTVARARQTGSCNGGDSRINPRGVIVSVHCSPAIRSPDLKTPDWKIMIHLPFQPIFGCELVRTRPGEESSAATAVRQICSGFPARLLKMAEGMICYVKEKL